MKLNICVITGTRAEYGLFLPLLKAIGQEPSFQLQLIATGAHLSPEFGQTYQEIEKDGFQIDEKVEMLLSSDRDVGTAKSVGLGVISLTDALVRIQPDWVVLLGDRFETFAAATAAYILKIPIAHIHGGETTEGAIDEGFRHAITKLAYLHFTSTETYRNRVIQLGENPERVFNVGAIGLDNVQDLALLNIKQLSESIHFQLKKPYALITFHPATLEQVPAIQQFKELLTALQSLNHLQQIFTYPNADPNSREMIPMLEQYATENAAHVRAFTNLGQVRYLSAMKSAAVVIGNSSSGIIEAPAFGIPTINIGDRQKGRVKADSVIDVAPQAATIKAAIEQALATNYTNTVHPYGTGGTAQKIVSVLQQIGRLSSTQKQFYDLNK